MEMGDGTCRAARACARTARPLGRAWRVGTFTFLTLCSELYECGCLINRMLWGLLLRHVGGGRGWQGGARGRLLDLWGRRWAPNADGTVDPSLMQLSMEQGQNPLRERPRCGVRAPIGCSAIRELSQNVDAAALSTGVAVARSDPC